MFVLKLLALVAFTIFAFGDIAVLYAQQRIMQYFPPASFNNPPAGIASCVRNTPNYWSEIRCGVNEQILVNGILMPWQFASDSASLYIPVSVTDGPGGICLEVTIAFYPAGSNLFDNTGSTVSSPFYAGVNFSSGETSRMKMLSITNFITSNTASATPFTIRIRRVAFNTTGCPSLPSENSNPVRIYGLQIGYK